MVKYHKLSLFFWVGGVFRSLLPKKGDFSRALYTFDIGQNDLTAGYKLNMSTEEVKAYVPEVLAQFTNVIKVRKHLRVHIFFAEFHFLCVTNNLKTYYLICKRKHSIYTLKVENHSGSIILDQWDAYLMSWTGFQSQLLKWISLVVPVHSTRSLRFSTID